MQTELLGQITLLSLLLITGITVFAGLVHGTLGLGFPMIATPLLSIAYDVRTAVILTLLPTMVVNIASIMRGENWRYSLAQFWPLPLYALVGAVVGTWFIASHDPEPYKLLLACLILLYLATQYLGAVNLSLLSLHPNLSMLGFGLIAGLAAGATNVMVPVLIIYSLSLGLVKNVMVQVFNMTFLAGKIAQTGVFAFKGALDLSWFLTTLPIALIGLFALNIGMAIRDQISAPLFTWIIKALLVSMALMLVAQYTYATLGATAA